MHSYHPMISLCSLLHIVPSFLLSFSLSSSEYNHRFFGNNSQRKDLALQGKGGEGAYTCIVPSVDVTN